jgi:DNA-binding CsgD family transcriptional regulator
MTDEGLGVTTALYDAALDADVWPAALATLAAALSAPVAVIKAASADRASAAVLATFGLEPATALVFGSVDPTGDPLCEAAARRPGEVVASDRDVSDREVAASELGRLILRPAGLVHALGAAVPVEEDVLGALWFFRPQGQPYGDAEVRLLAGWLPHLRRALTIHHRLTVARSASAVSSEAFNRLGLGAIVVDRRGRPLMTNRVAERLLAAGDGLALGGGMVCGLNSNATARLHAAVADVVREAQAARRTRSSGLRLERPSGARPYDVIVVSLAAPPAGEAADRPAAIVFIADPERTHVAPERLLRDLYGFTPAETRLAMVLAGGKSLGEAAESLGVSRNTAHSQLTSVFAKTGTGSQAELVRLLHRGPVAVRSYEDSAEFPPATGH